MDDFCMKYLLYLGTKFEHIKPAQECVRVITEWYSRLFVNSGTGDPVCQKKGPSTLVLYASVPYTILLLQDPYYWQQDPSFQRIVFRFHSYFTSSIELLHMLMEGYGYEAKMERERERERETEKERHSGPLSPRDEKIMVKYESFSSSSSPFLSLSSLHFSFPPQTLGGHPKSG